MKKILFFVLLSGIAWIMPLQASDAFDTQKMRAVLKDQPGDVKARYKYRNPRDTMTFFGVTPGSTVVEALPGGGWYSRILAEYLGPDGVLIGADYAHDMFPLFGFFTAEQLEQRASWTTDWVTGAEAWEISNPSAFKAFALGSLPGELNGTADTVLFIRALHNLARFEGEGGYLTQALADAMAVLKPGGTVGVVQHEARAEMPDDWASGAAGYLKRDAVIAFMEAAGFEFVEASEMNQNPKDQPTVDDRVWRLPPVLNTSREDPELRSAMQAIGESNRMVLKFRKPLEAEE